MGNTSSTDKHKYCDGCATGDIEYVDFVYTASDDVKTWRAYPCSQVKKQGNISPIRLKHCVHGYNKRSKLQLSDTGLLV